MFDSRLKVLAYFKKAASLSLVVVAVGCQSTTQSKVLVNYYQINGNSTAALDREIKRKGPVLGGGRHAVAVARISMIPNLKYKREIGRCSIAAAKVAVNAKVTLPAWRGRNKASPELGRAWDNIDRYTRLHEAVHVAMAFRYAKRMESELLGLPAFKSCEKARSAVDETVARVLKAHDTAQKQFDKDEESRLAKFARPSKSKS